MSSKAPAEIGATSFFLRKNWQIIYAAVLILLVPATIVVNTFFVIDRFRKTIDIELQRTALTIGRMFNATSAEYFDDRARLQQRLEDVAAAVPEARALDILAKKGGDFTVVASLDREAVGQTAQDRRHLISWYDSGAIAYLTRSPRSAGADQTLTPAEIRGGERFWGVVIPLESGAGEPAYLLSAKISLAAADELVRDNLFWSYIMLAITVLIIVLILASNTRLFQYASLFRRLKEVDKMKDDFISMSSHELRAPITAVRGYLSLFLDGAYGKIDEKQKQIMKTIFAIATHLGTLVEDLLDVSRIEQGRLKTDHEKLRAEEVIAEIVDQLKFEAEKKQLAFVYKTPEAPLPKIEVDRARFKQALINLCSNAIKYTLSGSITITSELRDGDKVEVNVIDTGVGMSAEQREKLFQKFYRIRTDKTAAIPGTGLGLWITKQIVELMKGRIRIDSIENVGTQASVVFPALKEETPTSPSMVK